MQKAVGEENPSVDSESENEAEEEDAASSKIDELELNLDNTMADTYSDGKKKKKKKLNKKYANSAFDSNISIGEHEHLHAILRELEFDTKAVDSYIVYLEMVDEDLTKSKKKRNTSLRIKYDQDMSLIRVETFPLKWLNIDIRNDSSSNKDLLQQKDVRFNFISEKEIDLDHPKNNQLKLKLKKCVCKEVQEEDNQSIKSLIVNEEFRKNSVYARHSKTIKYYAKFSNWNSLFNMAKVKFPRLESRDKLLENLRIGVSETMEFTDNDLQSGLFRIKSQRHELSISSKMHINTMSSREMDDFVNLAWNVAQVFSKIFN